MISLNSTIFWSLQYLLNKVNHGELPITEISRDNMKDFLDSHIGVELKWDKVIGFLLYLCNKM